MFKVLLAIVTFSVVASAAVVTFTTPVGSKDSAGDPVNATATFTTGAGFVDITFSNLLVGQKDVGQSISDLQFVLSTGQTSGTIGSDSGLERTVNTGKTYTDGAVVATGWSLQSSGGGLRLFVLGTAIGPAHTVIGPQSADNLYDNANGSMANNGPHNPFLAGVQTYHLLVTGVTASSTVTDGYFSFGTTEGDNVKFGNPTVPEPITSSLVGTGLVGLFFLGRRRASKKA